MDLQKHGQGDTIMVKIPYDIYESWWIIAAQLLDHGAPLEKREQTIFSLLTKWVQKTYPQYGIVAFEDLSLSEAQELSKKSGKNIGWGMYVLLQIGGSMQPISITDKLLGQ